MAVAEGRNGKIVIYSSAGSTAPHEVAEMGEWSISGANRNMIDFTAFGDVTAKYKPGMLDPGTLTFSGWYDASDSTGQQALITLLSSGTFVGSSSSGTPNRLQLWTNDDTSFDGYGYFMVPAGANCGVYITGMETGTNKDGLCSVSFTAKISGNLMTFSTG